MNTLARTILCCLFSASAASAAESRFDRDGFTMSFGDDDELELNLGGRLHLDNTRYDSDLQPANSGSDLRRARLSLSLGAGEWLRLRAEREFSDQGKGWKSLWATLIFSDRLRLRAGQHTAPFSMESIASSNNIPLMERSLVASLAPNLLLGAGLEWQGESSTMALGVFRNSLSEDPGDNVDDGRSLIGRITRNGGSTRQRWHLGIAGELRDLDDIATSRVTTQAGFAVGAPTLLSTTALAGVDHYLQLGAEAGVQAGPVNLQGQYMRRANRAPTLGNPAYDAAYVQVAYALTGEARRYSERQGTFTEIRPTRDFGALELTARMSKLNLNSGLVAAGRQTELAFGVNWYVGRNARVIVNHVTSKARPNRDGFDETVNAWGLRAQVDF